MRRSASESSLWVVPNCGIQVPPPLQAAAKAATGMLVGPDSVAVPAVKLTLEIFQRLTELEPKLRKNSGEPAGGGVAPSRSAGSTPPKLLLNWKQICVAAVPAIIEARSKAHNLEPPKLEPLL